MQEFLTILALITMALVSTSPALRRFFRGRVMTILFSGGWLAVALGVALGPYALALVERETVLRLTPLAEIGLGWIGFMIGLQASGSVLRALPGWAYRVMAVDVAASVVLFGAVAWIGLALWSGGVNAGLLIGPVALLTAGGIGWAMETRSLRAGSDEGSQRLALLVRAGGGLGAMAAVLAYGVPTILLGQSAGADAQPLLAGAALRFIVIAMLAVFVGFFGRYALTLAGQRRAELLVVFLGLIALVAGVAAELEVSPVFTAALAGAVIANVAGKELRRFERFILEAEHVVALLFSLLAGALLDPRIGVWGLALAGAIAAARLLMKPWMLHATARRSAGLGAVPDASPLYAAAARQSPLAIALAFGLAITSPSLLTQRLLGVVVLAGLLADTLPLLLSIITHRAAAARPAETPDTRPGSAAP